MNATVAAARAALATAQRCQYWEPSRWNRQAVAAALEALEAAIATRDLAARLDAALADRRTVDQVDRDADAWLDTLATA